VKPILSSFSFRQLLVTTALGLLLAQPAWAAATYTVLHNLNGTDAVGPWGGVTLDAAGNVFGPAVEGGGSGCDGYGCGSVFELMPQGGGDWIFSVLWEFGSGMNGAVPYGGVILDSSNNLYGTTTTDGPHNGGTAFKLVLRKDGWSLKTLYAFCSKPGCPDQGTLARLAWGTKGELYGTTAGGGTDGGQAFELLPTPKGWSDIRIHKFHYSTYGNPAPGGSNPYAGLIVDAAGNLYGTTRGGGKGYGVVFELTPAPGGGWTEAVLHRFDSFPNDGRIPGWGALFRDDSGSLYGTTSQGGRNICYAGCGTIFKLTEGDNGRWKETVLYNFRSGATGFSPNTGAVMDGSENLYGTTDYGGYGDCGVIYKLAPQPTGKWAYTVLHTFGHGDDGCMPEGNLAIDQNGNLYGGTVLGGAYGAGVVFRLRP
jgi:uncharacterized repeat protein (TIGR03803 family)